MRNLNFSRLAPLAALLVLVAILAWVAVGRTTRVEDKESAKVATNAVAERNKRCASKRTYEAIQQELFRQAAETRGSDEAAFGQISNYSIVRMEQPVVRSFDKELGTVRCAGKLILQLPRGISVVGGRQALAADIDYVLQPAADGSGDVVLLEGEAPITVPLATLAQSGSYAEPMAPALAPEAAPAVAEASPPAALPPAPAPQPRVAPRPAEPRPVPPALADALPPRPAPAAAPPAPPVAKAGTARPSFNCRHARTRGELAACRDPGLASLDRQMAQSFYRGVATGDASQREALRKTRNAFLRKRDRCSTDACIAASYRERMNEISAIVSR